MSYVLDFTEQAEQDFRLHKKNGNKIVLKKITKLLAEISIEPYFGTGKPEALKHNLSGKWSRRINLEHRIIYEVFDDTIVIYSVFGVYKT